MAGLHSPLPRIYGDSEFAQGKYRHTGHTFNVNRCRRLLTNLLLITIIIFTIFIHKISYILPT